MGECYFKAAATVVPGLFGDGSDGDLVIHNGETVSLPVTVPYQSVVEKQYNSITIEEGGVLKCDTNNAGLVLRCKGDCVINGTIDQSAKSPKPNPNNTYTYPEELACGNGGAGGNASGGKGGSNGTGGAGMTAMKYGGGWSGGGGGSRGTYSSAYSGGNGGSVADVTVDTPTEQLFLGGSAGDYNKGAGSGTNGGGGGGGGGDRTSSRGAAGGNGPGASATIGLSPGVISFGGHGGGAGNYGGGVVLLYVGGNLTINGTITCAGGNGGSSNTGNESNNTFGGAGGGGGGGAIYLVHFGEYTNLGNLDVSGGSYQTNSKTRPATAGGIGSITIKQYEKGMTV